MCSSSSVLPRIVMTSNWISITWCIFNSWKSSIILFLRNCSCPWDSVLEQSKPYLYFVYLIPHSPPYHAEVSFVWVSLRWEEKTWSISSEGKVSTPRQVIASGCRWRHRCVRRCHLSPFPTFSPLGTSLCPAGGWEWFLGLFTSPDSWMGNQETIVLVLPPGLASCVSWHKSMTSLSFVFF